MCRQIKTVLVSFFSEIFLKSKTASRHIRRNCALLCKLINQYWNHMFKLQLRILRFSINFLPANMKEFHRYYQTLHLKRMSAENKILLHLAKYLQVSFSNLQNGRANTNNDSNQSDYKQVLLPGNLSSKHIMHVQSLKTRTQNLFKNDLGIYFGL